MRSASLGVVNEREGTAQEHKARGAASGHMDAVAIGMPRRAEVAGKAIRHRDGHAKRMSKAWVWRIDLRSDA